MLIRASRNAPLARFSMAYILAGGRGSRLMELTNKRAKPAVFFGGKSRIIDFALSNALNSGIRHIAVATQYKAHSLIRHLQLGWNFFARSVTRVLIFFPRASVFPKTSGMSVQLMQSTRTLTSSAATDPNTLLSWQAITST